jgi:hypothetical protein
MQIHDELLAAAGGSSWRLPSVEAVRSAAPRLERDIDGYVAERNMSGTPWGVKSGPRLLEFVVPKLPSPVFVLVTRNPLDTARSAIHHVSRADFGLPEALAHGADTFAQCVELVRRFRLPYAVVPFEGLVADAAGTVAELAGFLRIDEPGRVEAAIGVVATRSAIADERQSAVGRERRKRMAGAIRRLPRRVVLRLRRSLNI